MQIKFKILYKNGFEDEIIQEFESEEEAKTFNQAIEKSFGDELDGIFTLGDSVSEGYYIRLSDVSRVKVQLL
jgi:hypothetical protein